MLHDHLTQYTKTDVRPDIQMDGLEQSQESLRKVMAYGKKKTAENVHRARNRVTRPEIAETMGQLEERYRSWKKDTAYMKDIGACDFKDQRMEQKVGMTGEGQVKSQLWPKVAKETASSSSSMMCSFGTTTPTQGVEALLRPQQIGAGTITKKPPRAYGWMMLAAKEEVRRSTADKAAEALSGLSMCTSQSPRCWRQRWHHSEWRVSRV